jgi:ectoine hydroxylase-related dioxygenase (phytanoyl-CoA dioxygenase family)
MDAAARRAAWNEKGYFVLRGLVSKADAQAVEDEVIAQIREYPAERYPGEAIYYGSGDYAIFPEKEPSPSAVNPEDKIAKVFNCHTEGMTRAIAESDAIADVVSDILGPEIDCFQSQFIFKNPGVIGQPWHQDSYYFRFNMQPQVGVWVALSRATLQNGCLWVLPGSHKGPIYEHIPDRRPAANRAYMEIVSQDDSTKEASLMEPGDVLFFHSYLMHMSTDNVANERRAAMVYHYARTGTEALTPEIAQSLTHVNRWIAVRRKKAA